VNLFAIPPGVPFLDAVASAWLDQAGREPERVAAGLVLLPTRRAARALAEAFLLVSGGHSLLLPRITAIGALDEAPLVLAGALSLPPAVQPARRLAVLTRLILGLDGRFGAPRSADRAWPLAIALADLLDEAAREGIDLRARLPDAAAPEYADHWQRTLEFLDIVTHAWPAWLAEEGLMDPVARRIALLHAQANAWEDEPADEPVWVAGATAAIPAVARLLRAVARMPCGRVILPALDAQTAEDIALDQSHPSAGLRRLLAELGARIGDVREWPGCAASVSGARAAALWRAMLPAGQLGEWRRSRAVRIDGLFRLDAADQQEEAAAIALILRGALETPGKRAALVTPDRDLAVRVAAELLRFGVVADDSAGERLTDTPPAVFLRLLADAVTQQLAPVPLLALLKHPLAAAGLAPAEARAAARALELACLRGPRPIEGLPGLRMAAAAAKSSAAQRLVERLETCIAPLLRIAGAAVEAPARAAARLRVLPSELVSGLIAAAEALAGTDTEPGARRLWAMEEGEALAALLGEVRASLPLLPDQPPDCLPGLLDAVLEGAVVRSRRAIRGRRGDEHPRVFIWGLLEARLQSADLMVLGGLAEGVWPPATDPGPWMSRPMRDRVGLPSPEQRIGQAAEDFVMACCAAPEVVLSCPRRRDGAPAVPARWLTRLEAMLAGQSLTLPVHPAAAWVRQLDQPAGRPLPAAKPQPRPPVALRPRSLTVTEIETWQRDPYAIYAKHVLRLQALDPLEQASDAADFGNLVHDALHGFLCEAEAGWPADPAERLRHFMDLHLHQARLHPAVVAWWRPRLARIADWIAAAERERRADPPQRFKSELSGTWPVPSRREFLLRGRADRIELRAPGRLSVLDYKTGRVPSQNEAESGLAPQLLLEAAMAGAGVFGAEFATPAGELAYWRLTGGFEPGLIVSLFDADAARITAAVEAAAASLAALIDRFDDPEMPYLARPSPGRAPRFSDYAQLARSAEWADAGEDDDRFGA
jgi:ATP-dependent helicase/nuclease subunit B